MRAILTSLVLLAAVSVSAASADDAATAPAPRPAAAGGRRHSLPTKLTAQQEAEVLAFLREHLPSRYRLLEKLRDENPSRYQQQLRVRRWWLDRLRQMPEKVQQAAVLQYTTGTLPWRLSRQWQEADDAEEKAKLRRQVHEAVAKLFDASRITHEHRITQLTESVKRRRDELRERAGGRTKHVAEIVQSHLAAATQPTEGADTPGKEQPQRTSPSTSAPARKIRGKETSGAASRWRLGEQQKQQTLEFLKDHLPEHHASVTRLQKDNPSGHQRALRRWYWSMRSWQRMREDAQKAYVQKTRASLQAKLLARQVRSAEPEARKALLAKLRTQAATIFDADLVLRRYQLDQLEERIRTLRTDLAERGTSRDKLITERVEKYLKIPSRRSRQQDLPTQPSK